MAREGCILYSIIKNILLRREHQYKTMVEYSTATGRPLKPCRKGYERNPETNRCRKKCEPGAKRSTRTKRCLKKKTSAGAGAGAALETAPSRKRKKPASKQKKKVIDIPNKTKKPKKTWNQMIKAWKSGRKLPVVKGSVFWETSVAKDGGESPYREKTRSASQQLPMTRPADPSKFKKHLKNKRTPVSFWSLGTPPTLLVVPPDTGKNFSHIGTFYANSSLDERRALWKKVAVELEKKLKRGEKVYVSTHGLGIDWLHVRLSKTPKYYHTSLAKTS